MNQPQQQPSESNHWNQETETEPDSQLLHLQDEILFDSQLQSQSVASNHDDYDSNIDSIHPPFKRKLEDLGEESQSESELESESIRNHSSHSSHPSTSSHPNNHHHQPQFTSASRAYIARSAPHLLQESSSSSNSNPTSSSPSSPSPTLTQSYPRSASRSRSQTPNSESLSGIAIGIGSELELGGNENESLIQDLIQGGAIGVEDPNETEGEGEGDGEGEGSDVEGIAAAGRRRVLQGGNENEDDSNRQNSKMNSSIMSSKHKVPPNYRGPIPRMGDAEEIAPKPSLIPISGSKTLFNTRDFPLNRNGYRYTCAGPSSIQLVQTVYKSIQIKPEGIHWSWSDRSTFTNISKDADVISTDKGFRSARSNIGIRNGNWLAEIEILGPEEKEVGNHLGFAGESSSSTSTNTNTNTHNNSNSKMSKDGPHVRLGWGRREAQLNAPVGFDAYSYGLRDLNGDKITMSRCNSYSNKFGPGDVIGIYISIPNQDSIPIPIPISNPSSTTAPTTNVNDNSQKIRRKRLPIRYKGSLYFEQLEYAQSKEMESLMERVRKGKSGEPDDLALFGNIDGKGLELFKEEKEKEKNKLGGNSNKKKNNHGHGHDEKDPKKDVQLRPIPILKGSKIGFFINGEPKGIAFKDLFDYKPIPKISSSSSKGQNRSNNNPNQSTSNKLTNNNLEGEESTAIITSSSSLAAIMKARENAFDDGELGYFPFVSCFGGARARLISGPEFKFDYPDDLNQVLEKVDKEKEKLRKEFEKENNSSNDTIEINNEVKEVEIKSKDEEMELENQNGNENEKVKERNWKPLSERYEEFKAEQWKNDLEDEERAFQRSLLFPNNQLPERQSSNKSNKSSSNSNSSSKSHKPSASQKIKLEHHQNSISSDPNSPNIGSPSDLLLMNQNLTPEHRQSSDLSSIPFIEDHHHHHHQASSSQNLIQGLNPNLTPENSNMNTPEPNLHQELREIDGNEEAERRRNGFEDFFGNDEERMNESGMGMGMEMGNQNDFGMEEEIQNQHQSRQNQNQNSRENPDKKEEERMDFDVEMDFEDDQFNQEGLGNGWNQDLTQTHQWDQRQGGNEDLNGEGEVDTEMQG